MNVDNQPKVFISYSWAIREWVGELANRLMNDGVEVKVDFWDLKNASNFWVKLSSRYFCEKILPFFNPESTDDLKHIIQENPVDSEYKYSGTWQGGVPKIPLKINKYGIAELT